MNFYYVATLNKDFVVVLKDRQKLVALLVRLGVDLNDANIEEHEV